MLSIGLSILVQALLGVTLIFGKVAGVLIDLESNLPHAFPVEGSRKGSQTLRRTADRFSIIPLGAALVISGISLVCSLLSSSARAKNFSMGSRVA